MDKVQGARLRAKGLRAKGLRAKGKRGISFFSPFALYLAPLTSYTSSTFQTIEI